MELTATAAEARAHFSRIADEVSRSGHTVTIFKNSKPWVTINPINDKSPVLGTNWGNEPIRIDPDKGYAILPSSWDDPADEGLYDDLVQ